MKLGKCRDCKHWLKSTDDSSIPRMAICKKAIKNLDDIKIGSTFIGVIYHCGNEFVEPGDIDIFTHKNFGCILFEEKEKN